MRDYKEYVLLDNVTPVAITSSTDATPIVVTATAHGLVTGDQVQIFGHTTNVAANGIFNVTKITANTFSIQDVNTGANIAGSGGGAGSSGLLVKNPKVINVEDFRNVIIQYGTSGSTTATAKVAGSLGKSDGSMPNFGGTLTPANPYSFLQAIDLDTGAAVNGATGFAATGTDLQKTYEVNVNAMKFLNLLPISWTQGAISARLFVADNE